MSMAIGFSPTAAGDMWVSVGTTSESPEMTGSYARVRRNGAVAELDMR
jgi:hypothetical protein